MSSEQPAAVSLSISFGDGDTAWLDRQTHLLQRELNAAGVPADIVREATAPEGARGVAEIIGLLQIATLLPVVVPKLIDVLQAWLNGRKGATIKLKVTKDGEEEEVEFSGNMTPAEVNKLLASMHHRVQQRP